MYPTHFGLRQRPFPATPDPARYYPSTSHERAIARLLGGLADGEGVLTLTGAPGTGKTLLCHCLLERLGPTNPKRERGDGSALAGASGLLERLGPTNPKRERGDGLALAGASGWCPSGGSRTRIAYLTNSHVGSRAGLLQAILYDLSLPYEGRGEQEMRLALTEHLLHGYQQGQGSILILDEAQHLTADLLEELRLLGNLEARSGKALQVVLVGQPALVETLRRPELAALWQRLAVRAEVEPLALQEAADYLLHHVRIAGGRPERLFADEALELLSRQTHGVPRLLNQAAHQALNLAAEAGSAQVDAEAALEALAMLGLSDEDAGADAMPLRNGLHAEHGRETEPSEGLSEGSSADASASLEDNASCRLILASERAN